MLERIAAMAADLVENGIQGPAGLALIVATFLAILVFAIFWAVMKNTKGGS